MIRHLLAALRYDTKPRYYCASCGGFYTFEHFH